MQKIKEVFSTRPVYFVMAVVVCLAGQAAPAAQRPPSEFVDALRKDASNQARISFTRVRSEERLIAEFLAEGYRRSPTFKNLIDAIERSDLLVYVRRTVLPSPVTGTMQMMGAANGQRVVFIGVDHDLTCVPLIAMIAHELQHAVEIANAPEVVDRDSLVIYYRHIGELVPFETEARGRSETYDTVAARRAAALVVWELASVDPTSANSTDTFAKTDGDVKSPNSAPEHSRPGQSAEPEPVGP